MIIKCITIYLINVFNKIIFKDLNIDYTITVIRSNQII